MEFLFFVLSPRLPFNSVRHFSEVQELVQLSRSGRKGPVFLEICLDVSGAPVPPEWCEERVQAQPINHESAYSSDADDIREIHELLSESTRPVFLLGGGISREYARRLLPALEKLGVPVMTTWNGADRIPASSPIFAGRPNTYGMRWSNVVIQQADLLVAFGTRLGLQQTGFTWKRFLTQGKLIQIDVDAAELAKEAPNKYRSICADANLLLELLLELEMTEQSNRWDAWREFIAKTLELLPVREAANVVSPGFVEPFAFVENLSNALSENDVVIPCSSGGAFTTMMQAFLQKPGQLMVTDKGLASMGYGLAGTIGAAFQHRDRRTVLVEGDGGFAQNLQEVGTVVANNLNVKMFIFSNDGYASIKTMQKAYFGGAYMGCDSATGLGLPDWTRLFEAYRVPVVTMDHTFFENSRVQDLLNAPGPAAFIVKIDPEQRYFPKLTSKVLASGKMESNPLHLLTPELDGDTARQVFPYLPESEFLD